MFKSAKKIVNFAAAFSMAAAVTLNSSFIYATVSSPAVKTFDLVEITDFHGNLINSYNEQSGAVLAKHIKDVENSNPDTIVFSAGDNYQGTAMSNLEYGAPVMKEFKYLGVQFSTLGNHEFDWGLNKVANAIYDTNGNPTVNSDVYDGGYPLISCNIYYKGTNKRPFAPYFMKTYDGVKVAFVGALTMDAPNIIAAAQFNQYEARDIATEVNSAAADARANGAQVVIASIHAGDEYTNGQTGELVDAAKNFRGVDAVFGGHTHDVVQNTITTADGKTVPLEIADHYGNGFIDLKMDVNSSGNVSFENPTSDFVNLSVKNDPNGFYCSNPIVDPNVTALIQQTTTEEGPILNVPSGVADIDLTRTQNGTQYGESLAGNWCTDIMRKAANADFAFQNNGGLRCDINKGPLTVSTMYAFMPFDNEIETVSMSVYQIKTLLEQAIQTTPVVVNGKSSVNTGKGIQVSGLKFTYNMSLPSMNRIVSISKADGTPLNLNDKTTMYKVATNDFMAGGGDFFTEFTDPAIQQTLVDTHILVRDALKNDATNSGHATASLENRITATTQTPEGNLQILATSDIHGNIFPYDYASGKYSSVGLAQISTYVKQQRALNPNLVLVDDGDTIQGTPLVAYYNTVAKDSNYGEYPMVKAMGLMKYDTWTLGNHEFNFGLDILNKVIGDVKSEGIKVLSANTYKTADNTNFVDPYYIKTVPTSAGDVKLGILGLTTKCIPNWEDPAHYTGLQFNDLVDEAKKWVPVMKNNGAQVIVVVAHSGEESASDTIPENEIKALAQNVSGIDAIVAGHAHSNIKQDVFQNPDGQNVIVTEPGKWGTYVSNINLALHKDANGNYVVDNKISDTIPMSTASQTYAADPQIIQACQPYQDATLNYINTKIGTSNDTFSGATQLTQETPIMDLINKVQLNASGAQLSIAAPLSSSALIPQGDIKIKDLYSVYVYENFLFSIKMNGAQIKKWLEYSARYYKQASSPNDPITKDPALNVPDYNLDQLYGAKYTIDITQPVGSRIKNLTFNGKPINDTDVFTVAINNYRYNGGGGFMAAAGLQPGTGAIYDSAKALGDGGQVRNLMINYIKNLGSISATNNNDWTISETPSSVSPFTVSNVSFTDINGSNITSLAPNSALEASVNFTNSSSASTTATMILELLDGNNRLQNIIFSTKNVAAGATENLGGGFNLPADVTNSKVKIFVWDNMKNMTPLSSVQSFDSNLNSN